MDASLVHPMPFSASVLSLHMQYLKGLTCQCCTNSYVRVCMAYQFFPRGCKGILVFEAGQHELESNLSLKGDVDFVPNELLINKFPKYFLPQAKIWVEYIVNNNSVITACKALTPHVINSWPIANSLLPNCKEGHCFLN